MRISASSEKNSVGACHCRTCRRWSGGPFMEVNCGQAVSFEGEEHVAIYPSSDWAERGFCRNCGTHLFYRLKEAGQHFVPIGLFDDAPELVFETQVFIDEKPSFYSFSNETHNMTGAELFAMFGSPD
ncbi:MAG: GFA family protein [Pseudomonadota bacterium]